jgi:integrase
MDVMGLTRLPELQPEPLSPVSSAVGIRDFVVGSRSEATRRAYRTDWGCFLSWCAQEGHEALPASPGVVAEFLVWRSSTDKPATLSRRLAAINAAHQLADLPSPTGTSLVSLTLSGIRRTVGSAQRQVRPILTEDLRALVLSLGDELVDARDKTLLLVGFAGALRRSELVALTVEDLEWTDNGLVVQIRKSKTDQEARGQEIGIPYGSSEDVCPVRALRDWLQVAEITTGPVFRRVDQWGNVGVSALHPGTVADVVKRHVEAVGLDPAQFAGHSLRAGLATSAAQNGASELTIMAQTRHSSSAMVKRYVRRGNLFRTNAAVIAGL